MPLKESFSQNTNDIIQVSVNTNELTKPRRGRSKSIKINQLIKQDITCYNINEKYNSKIAQQNTINQFENEEIDFLNLQLQSINHLRISLCFKRYSFA